jgi:hypothetical protein
VRTADAHGRWFHDTLVDGDLAINSMMWQVQAWDLFWILHLRGPLSSLCAWQVVLHVPNVEPIT